MANDDTEKLWKVLEASDRSLEELSSILERKEAFISSQTAREQDLMRRIKELKIAGTRVRRRLKRQQQLVRKLKLDKLFRMARRGRKWLRSIRRAF